MFFSVIVPVYNGEKYLPGCLEFLTSQTWRDFETVIVDDGSIDTSGKLADDYASGHDNVRVLHGSNQGLLLARRRGLEAAQGRYVVFLDSDDTLRSDALRVIEEAAECSDADAISFGHSDNADYSISLDHCEALKPGLYSAEKYQLVREHVCGGNFNSLWGKAIKRTEFDLDFDYGPYGGLMHGEDLFQLLPVIDKSSSLEQLSEVLYFYRQSDESSTARYRSSQLTDITRVNRRLRKYARRWGANCEVIARSGEVLQYIYLLKLSELSDVPKEEKRRNFSEICSVMKTEGVFARAREAHLRPDNHVLVHAMERGNLGLARLVVNAVEVAKR